MHPQHASWRKGSHAKATQCGDCHLPPGPSFRRSQAMAADGLRHAAIEGLHPAPDTLRLHQAGAQVVQANCLRCHPRRAALPGDGASRPKPMPQTASHADSSQACSHCHRETAHARAAVVEISD